MFEEFDRKTVKAVQCGTGIIFVGKPKSTFGEYANAAVIEISNKNSETSIRLTEKNRLQLIEVLKVLIRKNI